MALTTDLLFWILTALTIYCLFLWRSARSRL